MGTKEAKKVLKSELKKSEPSLRQDKILTKKKGFRSVQSMDFSVYLDRDPRSIILDLRNLRQMFRGLNLQEC